MKTPIFRLQLISVSLLTSLAVSAPAIAQVSPTRQISNLEIFSRCYAHITQMRLPLNHPKRAAVVAGTLSPVAACMEVLTEANLVASGTTEGQIASTISVNGVNESLAVLRNFNSLHINFTANSDLGGSVPNGFDRAHTRTAIDETEYAIHFTRALFTSGVPASEIVSGNSTLEALRSNGNYTAGKINPGVQVGQFLGVRKMRTDKLGLSATNYEGTRVNINGYEGGGVLGTRSYMSLNLGSDYRTANGGNSLGRRWSKAIFQDLMCRPLPVMRQADATPYVQAVTTNNTPSFRRSASCMACHATMDPMAGVARNLSFIIATQDDGLGGSHLFKHSVTLGAESGIVDADSSFHRRPPNGTLRYRSYDGTLVDQPLTSIADLGTKLAASNDFYACVASKYFRYFTGIQVNLADLGDPLSPRLSAADLAYRNQVIQMGQRLKTSQNLQSLIRDIISSPTYQRDAYRDVAP